MEVTFRYGEDVLMMDYIPSGDVDAGEVVVVGDIVGIAHRPILADQLGALGIQGGVYRGTGDAVIAVGSHVYWDTTENKVTETIGTNKYLGKCTLAGAGDDEPVEFAHLQPTSSAAGS